MDMTPEMKLEMIYGKVGIEQVPNKPGFTRSFRIDHNGVRTNGKENHFLCLSMGRGCCIYCGRVMDQKEYDDARKPWWKFW